MLSSNFEFVLAAIGQINSAHAKKSAFALFGSSKNDVMCTAKIDALLEL
jgi:hypothetical protein